ESFCDSLAKICKERTIDPPLIAGWDSFVTASFPEMKLRKKGETQFLGEGDKGRKVAVDKDSTDYQWGKGVADQHKWVWVWDGKGYERKRVAQTNGSDKLAAQKAADGKTALIANDNA